jgi:hypothetical protein
MLLKYNQLGSGSFSIYIPKLIKQYIKNRRIPVIAIMLILLIFEFFTEPLYNDINHTNSKMKVINVRKNVRKYKHLVITLLYESEMFSADHILIKSKTLDNAITKDNIPIGMATAVILF